MVSLKWRVSPLCWYGFGENPPTDAEVAERTTADQRLLEAVLPRLPEDLNTLAGQPVDGHVRDLHDGRVEAWEADLPGRAVLRLVCFDRQHGSERLTIEYPGAELLGATRRDLAASFANEDTELLYQEVDVLPDGGTSTDTYCGSAAGFGIRFDDISVTASDATPEGYDQAKRPASKSVVEALDVIHPHAGDRFTIDRRFRWRLTQTSPAQCSSLSGLKHQGPWDTAPSAGLAAMRRWVRGDGTRLAARPCHRFVVS